MADANAQDPPDFSTSRKWLPDAHSAQFGQDWIVKILLLATLREKEHHSATIQMISHKLLGWLPKQEKISIYL